MQSLSSCTIWFGEMSIYSFLEKNTSGAQHYVSTLYSTKYKVQWEV